MQRKVLKDLDEESRKSIENYLNTVPLFNLSKIRLLKENILSISNENIDVTNDKIQMVEDTDQGSRQAIDFIVSSPVFCIHSQTEAYDYFNDLSEKSRELIVSYLQKEEVIDGR